MVRNYKKKGQRSNYSDDQMQLALNSINDGKSIKSCAAEYGIPRSTLQRKLQVPSSNSTGFTRTFTNDQETALYLYVIDMEERLMGLSSIEMRKLAFDFAVKLGVSHNFDEQTSLAGKDWLRSFMKRHDLSNRKAEPTSAARANGFNQEEVQKFFVLLKGVQDKCHFSASNIWNVDETGISIVPKSGSRVIARRGRRQVGGKTSAERGETVSAEICMSATGIFMPPMLIFPCVKVNENYLQGKPEGSWAVFRKSGWMETDIFTEWFKKFIIFSRASVTNPILLLLDGHHTHVKNLEVSELGKANGVTILCFPPHCTHKMQPLDVAFMKPLSTFYTKEINHFQRSGTRVQMKDIFSIFGRAWQKAAKIETAVNAFKKTGITPLNVNIFDSQFQNPHDDLCSSPGTSSDPESTANVKEYKQIIDNIMVSNNSSIQNVESNSTSHVPLVSCSSLTSDTSPNSLEPVVTIPLSYITNAKPLLSLLNSTLVQQVLNLSNESNKQVQSNDLQANPSNEVVQNMKENVDHLSEKIVVSRKRGTAAIVTSDEHIQELNLQKNKKIKKEPQEKKKAIPKIKSDVALKQPKTLPKKIVQKKIDVPKRQPFTDFNYQFLQANEPNDSLNAQILHVVDSDDLPVVNSTFFMQTADGQYEPFIVESVPVGDVQLPINNVQFSEDLVNFK